MWLNLNLLNNCFNDKAKKHLGLKFKDKWYAITHLNTNEGSLIPKKFLRMRDISERPEFLKRLNNSAPNLVEETNMKIHIKVLKDYDKFKLDSLENKRRRYVNKK